MTAPLLEVRGLRIEYRTRRSRHVAVDGASLDVARGETVALVGESGSGKTSIGRAVLGLHRPTTRLAGSIRLDGRELLGLPERGWRGLRGAAVSLVPQDPLAALDPLRRVGDQVAEVLRVHGIATGAAARERALQAMREAGLPQAERLAARYPHQLSGGQRQRVLIAAAIVAEPRLIVADEPTSALDVTVQRTILDRLQALAAASGTAMLLITHDLAVAAERADRIVALADGRIVEQGSARQVVTAPQHASTRSLVEALPQRRPHPLVVPAAPDAPVVLRATGLRRAFGSGDGATLALDDVDVTLRRGQSLGVVGESGSGKTTLARVLLGLERPDAGAVELDGAVEGPRRSRAFRRRVQPVFQDPYSSLDPSHSVGHAILEPVRALTGTGRAARRRLLAELLDRVRLPQAVAGRLPGELSGGQLQRVAIARALSVSPEVLVCDEAVSALDVTIQAQVLELLAELQREQGLTSLFITHDLSVLRLVCDTVAVMRDGRVVEQGPTERVLAAPAHPYTRALIDAIPAWEDGAGAEAAAAAA